MKTVSNFQEALHSFSLITMMLSEMVTQRANGSLYTLAAHIITLTLPLSLCAFLFVTNAHSEELLEICSLCSFNIGYYDYVA
jgi:hypothetical protein